MESKKETSYTYKVEDSAKRMDDILDTDDNDYEDKENSIPKRSDLTFKNGSKNEILNSTTKCGGGI